MSAKLKIHVDQDRCQGHARCKSLAPDLFELDEFGNAREVGDGSGGVEAMAELEVGKRYQADDGPEDGETDCSGSRSTQVQGDRESVAPPAQQQIACGDEGEEPAQRDRNAEREPAA